VKSWKLDYKLEKLSRHCQSTLSVLDLRKYLILRCSLMKRILFERTDIKKFRTSWKSTSISFQVNESNWAMYISDYLTMQLRLLSQDANVTVSIHTRSSMSFWKSYLSCSMTQIKKSTFVETTTTWFKNRRNSASFILNFNNYSSI